MKSLTGKVQGEYKEKQTWMMWLHDITETRSQSWPETLKIVRNSEPRPSALSDMAHNNDDADEQVFKNKGGGMWPPPKIPDPGYVGHADCSVRKSQSPADTERQLAIHVSARTASCSAICERITQGSDPCTLSCKSKKLLRKQCFYSPKKSTLMEYRL